jgi:hypothetical protein
VDEDDEEYEDDMDVAEGDARTRRQSDVDMDG